MGIGGISMSGLAEILLKEGFQISGSDRTKSELTDKLESKGIKIYYGQRAENISESPDLVVYTAAIHTDNPEYQEVLHQNIPMLSRAELLGQLMHNYDMPIAISGTHGKTTTTSMISEILIEANMDPTLSIGGIYKPIGGNIRIGNSEIFVTEACEYTNSFLHFNPKIGLVLNVEEDHLDFFKDIQDIRNSFHNFAELLPSDGTLVINAEIDHVEDIMESLSCNIITYGFQDSCNYSASDIVFDEFARPTFQLKKNGTLIGPITLGVTGTHNVSNALAVIALADLLNVPISITAKALTIFSGGEGRFEYRGSIGGITVIDDNAHHPTGITETLNAAKDLVHETTWCVFQPHTYTRTKAFFDEFATALSLSDRVILADIYAARETDTLGVSSKQLAAKINELGTKAYYFPSFDEIENFLLENCINGDLLITMGAGDVVKIGENLLGI